MYSRKDIYFLLKIPVERQGGNWNTGYNSYNNDWFIFANVNTSGRTGHNYKNRFIENGFEWYAKNRSKLHHKSVQSMINPVGCIFIFVRENNKDPMFTFMGNGRVNTFFDESPVRFIWTFDE